MFTDVRLRSKDKRTTPQKAGHPSRVRQQPKKYLSLLEVSSSQSETALCSAMLAQSGTDAMVSLVPWPVPGHQRLDARQKPLMADTPRAP